MMTGDERLPRPRTIAAREAARRRLPRGLFEFTNRGTKKQLALASDRAA